MRSLPAYAYRLLLPAAVLAAFLRARTHSYWLGAAWALVMLFAMLGWGSLVERLLRPSRGVDFGLRLGWGMATTLVVGSVASAAHLASRPFLLGQVGVGCALACGFLLRRPTPLPTWSRLRASLARPAAYVIVLVGVVGVSVELLGMLGATWFEPSDDPPLYYYFPEKVVQTGTFFEPFAVRRVTTYGGQVYLHALYLAMGRHYQLNVVDAGIGSALVLALLVGATAERGLRRAHVTALALGVFVLLTIRDVRFNVAAEMTGLAACLAMYRTFSWALRDRGTTRADEIARVLVIAACAVAGCVLRTSNAVVIALFLAAAVVRRRIDDRLPPRELAIAAVRDLLLFGAVGLALLLPWLVMFNESVGTFVYPLRRGNITPGFTIVKAEPGFFYNLKHLARDLTHDRPFTLTPLALVAGTIMAPRGRRGIEGYVPLLCVVCFFGICVMSYAGGTFDETVNSRYTFAFVMWTIFAVILAMPRGDHAWRRTSLGAHGALIAAMAVAHIALTHEEARKRTTAHLENIERASENSAAESTKDEWATQDYRDVQYHAVAGESIVVAVAEPFRFDMKRNRVYTLDQPGAMGPGGKYPVFEGPEVVAKFFLANGVRYIIAMDFHNGHELFHIERWKRHLLLQNSFLNYEAPYMIDGMENIEKLAQSRKVVYSQFGLRLIDLRERIETPPN